MPSITTAFLTQRAVLWVKVGNDSHGLPTLTDAPCEIAVGGWGANRSQAMDPQGNKITVDASAFVDRRIPVDSVMWLGKLSDWLDLQTPKDADRQAGAEQRGGGLMEVKTYSETPDLKGREHSRKVGLMRYKGVLPASAT